jgi:putative DNA primase/helicase
VKPAEAKARPKQKASTRPKREGDAAQISQQLADRVEDLCITLLPAGRRVGHEWRAGSLGGEPGKSLGVRLDGNKAGIWCDFATNERGDPLDLVAAVEGLDIIGAMDWARDFLGKPAHEARKKPGAGSMSQPETRPPYSSLNPPFPHMKAPPLAKPGEQPKRALPRATIANARVAIRAMQVSCRFDEFHDCYLIDHAGQDEGPLTADAGALNDGALLLLRLWIERVYGFDPTERHVNDAVRQLCRENRFDPVREYLDGLKWDGTERLDTWLVTYLGAKDTPLHSAFGRLTLVAAVRRARQPGCKKDEVLVLEGPEGKNKSTAILVLAGGEAYFSDQPILGLNDREQQERMRGTWLFEVADLNGMKKAEVDHVKAFCSRTHDRARPAYGHALVELPCRCIFIGTTNDQAYLKSQTGNRRFWPVAAGKIDIAALRRDRDQLWAEAATIEATGVALTLPTELWADAAEEQDARRVVDVWEERIDEYLAARTETSLAEVLESALEIPPSKQTQIEQNRVAACLRQLGFERYQKRDGKRRLWRYRR